MTGTWVLLSLHPSDLAASGCHLRRSKSPPQKKEVCHSIFSHGRGGTHAHTHTLSLRETLPEQRRAGQLTPAAWSLCTHTLGQWLCCLPGRLRVSETCGTSKGQSLHGSRHCTTVLLLRSPPHPCQDAPLQAILMAAQPYVLNPSQGPTRRMAAS